MAGVMHDEPKAAGPLRAASLAAALWAASLATHSLAADPPWTDAEMEDFLRRAEITHSAELSIGVTHSRRATLSLDGVTHDAHIQTVDVMKRKARVRNKTELEFRDSYRYNIAAYRLDRMLGLRMVPVSVERTVDGEKAAVTWWVDDVLMMESERVERKIKPPHGKDWILQGYRRRVLNELVHNTDFNQSNQLIARDWQVWLIDFTRAFRRSRKLYFPGNLWKIETSLLERLRGLTREEVEDRLGGLLTRPELKGLLARRDAIVEYFEDKAAREGEAAAVVPDG